MSTATNDRAAGARCFPKAWAAAVWAVTVLVLLECGGLLGLSAVRLTHLRSGQPDYEALPVAVVAFASVPVMLCQLVAVLRRSFVASAVVGGLFSALGLLGVLWACLVSIMPWHDDGDWNFVYDGLVPCALIASWLVIGGIMVAQAYRRYPQTSGQRPSSP
jgi:hypothetical protein